MDENASNGREDYEDETRRVKGRRWTESELFDCRLSSRIWGGVATMAQKLDDERAPSRRAAVEEQSLVRKIRASRLQIVLQPNHSTGCPSPLPLAHPPHPSPYGSSLFSSLSDGFFFSLLPLPNPRVWSLFCFCFLFCCFHFFHQQI